MLYRNRPDLQQAAKCFTLACAYSREWDSVGAQALSMYGDHGSQISGCLRDHFPEATKDTLRTLARQVSEHIEAAWSNRPKCVRISTMRRLGREIAKHDGCGFYGPQI